MNEELFEEGIVLKSSRGTAEIALKENDSCEECSAKIFCSPQKNKLRTLLVSDPLGTLPGDEVKISVNGKEILKASLLLYGLPLILVLTGIIIGMSLFENYKYAELYSFISGLSLSGLYFYILFIKTSKKKQNKTLSRIISVHRPGSIF